MARYLSVSHCCQNGEIYHNLPPSTTKVRNLCSKHLKEEPGFVTSLLSVSLIQLGVGRFRSSIFLIGLWISLAHDSKGKGLPSGVCAYSTRGVAASCALFKGIRIGDMCAAASWGSQHTIVSFIAWM
jgi:hypothetical protein